MRDFLGQVLEEGDRVVYITQSRTSAGLSKGTVVGFTTQFVRIYGKDHYGGLGTAKHAPHRVVKVAAPEAP